MAVHPRFRWRADLPLRVRWRRSANEKITRRPAPTQTLLVAFILASAVPACRSSASKLSPTEATNQAKACMSPDSSVPYLPAPRPDLQECLKKAMRDPTGRRFLLDAGNAALEAWSAGMVRFVDADLATHPEKRALDILGNLGGPMQSPPRRVGRRSSTPVSYRRVRRRQRRARGGGGDHRDLGVLRLQGPAKGAEAFIRNARGKLPDPKDTDLKGEALDTVATARPKSPHSASGQRPDQGPASRR